jgi:hypothetical protein
MDAMPHLSDMPPLPGTTSGTPSAAAARHGTAPAASAAPALAAPAAAGTTAPSRTSAVSQRP